MRARLPTGGLAGLPIPVLLVAICVLWPLDTGVGYDSPRLLLGLNLIFSNLTSLIVAYLVGRGFLARGSPGLLLLGCGVLLWGTAGSVGVVAGFLRVGPERFDPGALVTVHNLCVWLGALCHLAGAVLGRRLGLRLRWRWVWLVFGYCLAFAAVGVVLALELGGWFPAFIVAGEGGTPVRFFVLGSAICLFMLTALLLKDEPSPGSAFAHWYALALLLLAVGLFGVMLQSMPGSPVGWMGRVAQFLAGVYMLVAAAAALRESGSGAAAGLSLGDSLAPADNAPAGVSLTRPLYPYMVALVLVVSAAALRLAFLDALGMRVSFLVFYPAVALAALYGGLRAGLSASLLSGLLADWLWIEPAGSLAMAQSADVLSLAVFFLSCALISWTAEWMLRAQARAAAAEREALLADELARQAERLREQAEALQEADRRKDELLAMLGHELRNPLTPILTAAQLLELKGCEDPALVRWAAATIKHQGQSLTRLVDDLLDASRVTQGKIALSQEPLALADLVARVLESGRHHLDERHHRLVLEPCAEPLTVEGDTVRLEQVFGNLLNNAAKYTPDGGQIRVALAREGDFAVVRIEDNGIGISAALLPKVCGLFVQAERGRERAQGGLGIGLALVKSLAQMHGGRFEIASPGAGLGTRTAVWLPLKGGAAAVELPQAAAWTAGAAPRYVLVVDDNAQVLASLEVLIAAMGHRVRTAASGEQALALLKAEPPDAMLVDIGMPGLDGYAVARRVRRDPGLQGLKLIAMSGYGQPEDRARSVQAGFDRHLVKPFDPAVLAEILAEGA